MLCKILWVLLNCLMFLFFLSIILLKSSECFQIDEIAKIKCILQTVINRLIISKKGTIENPKQDMLSSVIYKEDKKIRN